MNYHTLKKLQKQAGAAHLQNLIDTGAAWLMEGSTGRAAMEALKSGVCMLPKESHRDAYGNRIPSRDEVKPGTAGSFALCAKYYENLEFWEDVYEAPTSSCCGANLIEYDEGWGICSDCKEMAQHWDEEND